MSLRSDCFSGILPFITLFLISCCFTTSTLSAQSELRKYLELEGTAMVEEFGRAMACAGDVDGDGFDDIICSGRFNTVSGLNTGSARVYSGQTGDLIFTLNGDAAGDGFGNYLDGVGDVNNDGFDDVIVSAPYYDTTSNNVGRVRVYSGADASVLYDYVGQATNHGFGLSVAGVGDLNGDGRPDFAIAAPVSNLGGANSGAVFLYSGVDGSLIHTVPGNSQALFGWSIAAAADLNSDGFDDVAVGAVGDSTNGTQAGSVILLSGFDASVLYVVDGPAATAALGNDVASLGDITGDGVPDLIAGLWQGDMNGTDSGSALVFSGANGASLFTVHGDAPATYFGRVVSGAGDVNGDGTPDFVVCSTHGAGFVRIFSGTDASIIQTIHGGASGDQFGTSMELAGDVNGDGCEDLLIGAPGYDDGGLFSIGQVTIFSKYARFPGSSDDFEFRSGVNEPANLSDKEYAGPGDTLLLEFDSPGGAYDYTVPVFVSQVFATGSPIPQPLGFAEVWINPAPFLPFPVTVHFDGNSFGLGVGTLPPAGMSFAATVPPNVAGLSVMVQAFALAPSASTGNGIFTATDGHCIEFQ